MTLSQEGGLVNGKVGEIEERGRGHTCITCTFVGDVCKYVYVQLHVNTLICELTQLLSIWLVSFISLEVVESLDSEISRFMLGVSTVLALASLLSSSLICVYLHIVIYMSWFQSGCTCLDMFVFLGLSY